MDEPAWCDPNQCTAHKRIPNRPASWAAHRSAVTTVTSPRGAQVSAQLVRPAHGTRTMLFLGIGPRGAGGISTHIDLDGGATLADGIRALVEAGRA
ncbi:hypothetical protein JCM9534A_82710 [Catenuloplanes indicus JCM 9534]